MDLFAAPHVGKTAQRGAVLQRRRHVGTWTPLEELASIVAGQELSMPPISGLFFVSTGDGEWICPRGILTS